VFTKRALAAGSLSIFVQFFAFFGFIFVVLQYLQLVRGDSALVAGLSMLPMAATLMPFARLAPVVVERFGSRAVCVTGLLLIAAGMVVLAQLDAHSSYWLLLCGLLPELLCHRAHAFTELRRRIGPCCCVSRRRPQVSRPVAW
jgi:Na+/melibiose symporter-like transporter